MFFDNLFDNYNPFGTYSFRQPRPQTSTYYREEKKSIVLREILNDEYNYMCFDCHRELRDLDYFDLMNGVFLCYNCAQHHAKLSKEITKPMTGRIRTLDEKDLLILYYGGNKNLLEFIRRNYPLLENKQAKEMYSTKAMDYYRKLLRSKAYNEPEPEMPSKKIAYSSIFQKKINPATEKKQNNLKEKRMREPFEKDEDEDRDIFSSTFFGDDLFNRNKQQKRKNCDDEDNYFETEPADINKREAEENDDAGMKIEKRNISNEKKETKEQKKTDKQPKYKKIEKKFKKEDTENKGNEIKVNNVPTLTINQIGELSRYPEAMEIDGMECE